MFTAYVDDSGTAPTQKVAIATGLIVPARRVNAFQSEWNTFSKKWGNSDFHSSECAVANPKSDFAGWDKVKVFSAFQRIRQITKKYGVKCISLAVNKADYDAVVPLDLRPVFGNHHYTWAMHSLLALLDQWACRSGVEHPIEYKFDWIDPKSQRAQKLEIEGSLARCETARPGRFLGRYAFRRRKDYPGLQCADLLGWVCFRFALKVFGGPPLTPLQLECWNDFERHRLPDSEWLVSIGQTRKMIQDSVDYQKRNFGLTPTPWRPRVNDFTTD